jgi:hypothetical protein
MHKTVYDTTLTLDNMRQSVDFIESFASRAWVYGQRMATFSHFLALINAAFVLTSTEMTQSARPKLFIVASLNAALEYLAWWAIDRTKINQQQHDDLVLNVRTWCILFCIVIFCDSIRCWLASRFSRKSRHFPPYPPVLVSDVQQSTATDDRLPSSGRKKPQMVARPPSFSDAEDEYVQQLVTSTLGGVVSHPQDPPRHYDREVHDESDDIIEEEEEEEEEGEEGNDQESTR